MEPEISRAVNELEMPAPDVAASQLAHHLNEEVSTRGYAVTE